MAAAVSSAFNSIPAAFNLVCNSIACAAYSAFNLIPEAESSFYNSAADAAYSALNSIPAASAAVDIFSAAACLSATDLNLDPSMVLAISNSAASSTFYSKLSAASLIFCAVLSVGFAVAVPITLPFLSLIVAVLFTLSPVSILSLLPVSAFTTLSAAPSTFVAAYDTALINCESESGSPYSLIIACCVFASNLFQADNSF
jgi:hypothetical protein